MKNKQIPSVIIPADTKVFDYLKEKVGERKTRTEAYCDLLDKSLAGFVSPFLRKQDCELHPNQCHVTVSDLATEWHWHRATVRSFLETMEELGLLSRTKFTKSIIITMTVQSVQTDVASNVHQQRAFDIQLREALSEWIVGKATSADVGKICGQAVRQAMTGMTNNDSTRYSDSHVCIAPTHVAGKEEGICHVVLGYIAHAAFQRVLRKSRFNDSSPLVQFFQLELGEEWASFIELSKELAELILGSETENMTVAMSEAREHLESLRSPFLSLAARAQETSD